MEQGAPARTWRLDCTPCEDHLRHDPHWSATIAQIPETHDEKIVREDLEQRGSRNQQQMTALALAKLAGIPGAAEALGMAVGAGASQACPEGHPNPPGARFCVECGCQFADGNEGTKLAPCGHASPATAKFCVECGSAIPAGPPVASPASAGPPEPEPRHVSNREVRAMRREDLVALASERGLDTTGNRNDLIGRLLAPRAAG